MGSNYIIKVFIFPLHVLRAEIMRCKVRIPEIYF